MTTITDFVYRVTVVQYAPTDGPDYLWSNTWEISSPAGLLGDQESVEGIANAFSAFHRFLLLPRFGVDRVVVSTYGPDLPWPPGFAVFPYRLTGEMNAGGAVLPLSVVAFIRKNVLRGRDGKAFLRGALTSDMISGEEFVRGGVWDFPARLNTASGALFSALEANNVRLVLASGPVAAIQSRDVTALSAVNARTLQYRTRRKTRLQQNALGTLASALQDGAVGLDEVGRVLDALRRLFPAYQWPELPPPVGD